VLRVVKINGKRSTDAENGSAKLKSQQSKKKGGDSPIITIELVTFWTNGKKQKSSTNSPGGKRNFDLAGKPMGLKKGGGGEKGVIGTCGHCPKKKKDRLGDNVHRAKEQGVGPESAG